MVILYSMITTNLPYISSKEDMPFLQGEYSESPSLCSHGLQIRPSWVGRRHNHNHATSVFKFVSEMKLSVDFHLAPKEVQLASRCFFFSISSIQILEFVKKKRKMWLLDPAIFSQQPSYKKIYVRSLISCGIRKKQRGPLLPF